MLAENYCKCINRKGQHLPLSLTRSLTLALPTSQYSLSLSVHTRMHGTLSRARLTHTLSRSHLLSVQTQTRGRQILYIDRSFYLASNDDLILRLGP